MGFALPAAIGAKFARRDAEVWVIAGDGGFQMTMPELATAAQEQIDLNIAVINNGYLGMVRQWQQLFEGKRYSGTPLSGPSFAGLAEAYGLRTHRTLTESEAARDDGSNIAGISHAMMAEHYALPGQLGVGTDSHTPHSGALGCVAFGVGTTDMANAFATGAVRMTMAPVLRVDLEGRLAEAADRARLDAEKKQAGPGPATVA